MAVKEYPVHVCLEHVNRWLPDEVREQLRAARLLHGEQMVRRRQLAADLQKMGHQALAKQHEELASRHLKAIQALNVFFEDDGDTVDRDMDNARRKGDFDAS